MTHRQSVATDSMSRGLDWGGAGGVALVVECPIADNAGACAWAARRRGSAMKSSHLNCSVAHLHRIGRTARAGD